MCGFIGRISGTNAPAEELRRGLPWISRRGPDSQRTWSSSDGRVGILFCRLSIVDRDPRAHQPLTKADAGVTVGMVGEIYNYRELRKVFSDYPFSTDSDTEMILAAYTARGTEGLNLLKGMFAFVVVDERSKKIFLVRDAIGKKPLFVARWGTDVLFGSSLLPLAAVRGNVQLDTTQAAYYWKHSFIHPGSSIFAGAAPVLPGQLLEYDWTGQLVRQGRCEPKPALLYAGEALEQVQENTGALIRTAVERRLANNPEPVALLSGGVDSTLVTSIADPLCRRNSSLSPLRALTLGSLVPLSYDERYARYAAHRLGLPLQILNPKLGALGDSVIHALDLQDEPLGMPSYFLLERLTHAAAQHGRVLLSGEGGDEIFLGYGKPADWREDGGPTVDVSGLVPCGPPLPQWMSPWARETVTNTLVGHMFTKADRATAEQGVELRCPLLDWDVVCYARSVPFGMLTHGEKLKTLLKAQLKGWPEWFLERPKAGFTYNLRWLWGMSLYSGLRENIDPLALEMFGSYLPASLRGPASRWKTLEIFRHFPKLWQLLAWSRFLSRFNRAISTA